MTGSSSRRGIAIAALVGAVAVAWWAVAASDRRPPARSILIPDRRNAPRSRRDRATTGATSLVRIVERRRAPRSLEDRF